MELIAALSRFPASDVLQWSGTNRFDGHLVFRGPGRTTTLSSSGGRIVQASSNHRLESFGRHLFSRGLVDEVELAAAGQADRRTRLGRALAENGVLRPEVVREALAEHTMNLVCTVAAWEEGVVSAHAATLRPLAEIEPEPLDPFFAVMEAARRVDEIERLRDLLPHDNVELGLGDGATPDELPTAARRLMEHFAPGDTAGQLYERLGGSRFAFLVNLGYRIAEGTLTIAAVGAPPPEPESNLTSLMEVLLDEGLDQRRRA